MDFSATLLDIWANTSTEGVYYEDLTDEGITLVAPSGVIVDICFNWTDGAPEWTLEAYRDCGRYSHIVTIPCDTRDAVAYADDIFSKTAAA